MAAGNGADPRIVLPQPRRMVLRNFSLYRRRRSIEVDFERAVFCLAGANGLGKSTFLSALNFAMTGAVPRPELNFLGASQYYEETLPYSARFFDGRIRPADHDVAEVELEMTVGEYRFVLVRGMFSPQGLRGLQVTHPDGTVVDTSGPELTEAERHRQYVDAILAASGLESFAQLVFLQLFVLTFDEQRRLLFWSDRVAEQALFLAFGISPETAVRAEALQRAYDSAESKARNLQWQATGVRKRLNALDAALGSEPASNDDSDLEVEHMRLTELLSAAGAEHARLVASVAEAEVAVDEAVTQHLSAQREYDQAYADRLGRSRSAHLHPVVLEGLDSEHCNICGTDGPEVAQALRASLDRRKCPLCGSTVSGPDTDAELRSQRHLTELGAQVVARETAWKRAGEHLDRQRLALDEADRTLRNLDRELERFRAANTQALLRVEGKVTVVDDARRGMQREIADLLEQKDEHLVRRDSAQMALDELRHELTGRFAEMEDEFVPLLQELAQEFLGVPLQVDLERRGAHIGLELAFDGSQRSAPDTLSESQRFFMDIALRMALARKLSREGEPATLYIDTPEGSLDIAYESRAGRMFGRFAESSNRILMTANVNTSRLLLELAGVCGREDMELVRMTEWTDLTDVQQEAEGLFEQAYAAIDRRLDGDEG